MDENTIRLWLKQQQDAAEKLAQQQAAAFQLQFDALREELQAARGLLQARHGGGGEPGLPRSMRLDVPKVAAEWFRWMTRNGLITDWARFEESVKNRFGPSKYEDPQGALSKLLQTGLKLSLQRELLVSKPTTLGDAFSLSRVTEARLGDQTSATIVPKVNHRSGSHCQRPTAAIVPKVTSVAKPSHLRWTQGHNCPGKFLLLMTDNDEDTREEVTVAEEEGMESGDISILNSLVGHGSPRSLQLWGKIGDTMVHILIDNGSTHNFIRPDVVECLRVTLHVQRLDLKDEEGHGVANNSTSSRHLEIEQPLIRYDSLFQVPTCLPPNRAIDHRIHLLPNTKPVNVRPYRYPHYQKGEMENLVTEMLGQGIIRFSHSPFLSPVLLVKKKDGSYHFCVDYRALNAMTVKEKFLFPTADEMFDELGGASIFTKLDLRAGYHQIRVHERDVYKTAFCTHDGHYEFLVMPFGLTNAPSTFQATMNRLFFPYLRKFVIVFFDDILVYSTTLSAHLEHLECVFHCLQEHQFFVKRSKCVFGAGELEYLGHVISARGVEMDPKKLLAVRDWPEPKNQRHVRGFLGLAGYYRRFIRGYASLTAPLTDLLKHEGFKWGEEESKAFQILKERLSNAPLLSLPNFEQVFVIEADASEDGIGAVLMQENRPISYFSRKLGPRMRVAATYQKELFAIVEAVYKWRQYLLGRRFTIRTDHKSIKELMQQVIQTPLQQKYVRKLMGFDFSIEYKPGATNKAADALSRMFEEDQQLTASFMALSQPIFGFLGDLRGENEALAELRDLHKRLDNGDELSGFRRENGLLFYKDRYYIGQESKLKTLLLREFHDSPSAGHGGIKKTLVGLSALFFWKGMRQSVEEFIKKCVVCQQIKYSTEALGGYLQPLPTPTAVWEDVSMDFITGLPTSKGSTVIFVVVDRLTKYAHFGALPTSFNAHKVAELFVDIVVKHHGIPKTIVSDRDPIFVSNFWKQLFLFSGTQLSHSTAYHPQTDGQTEVVNRCLEQYLRAMVINQPHQWVRLLPWAEYCYNSSYHSSIKMSPFQALYGRQPLSVIPYPPGSSKVAAVDGLLVERDGLLRQLKESLLTAKHRMEVKANCKRRDIEFSVGDLVLVKLQPYRQVTLAKRLSNKLAKRYYGPYKVEARVGKVAYRLALPASSKIHPVFHVSILKAFVGSDSVEVAGLPEELQDGQPVEQPLTICDTRRVLRNGSPERQVLVQWIGGSPEEATWEWLSEFKAAYPRTRLFLKLEGMIRHLMVNFGAFAVLVRQTNIIWVLFVACTGVLDLIQAKQKRDEHMLSDPKDGQFTSSSGVYISPNLKRRKPGNTNDTASRSVRGTSLLSNPDRSSGRGEIIAGLGLFSEIWSILLTSWHLKWELLVSFSPFFALLVAFVAFIVWNGSIVLGAKEAHAVSPHFAQLLYYALVSCCFMAPMHFSTSQASNLARAFWKNRLLSCFLWFLVMIVSFLLVHYFSIAHPYLLADNRHYPFYLWRKIINAHWSTKYLLVPLYVYSWTSILTMLGQYATSQCEKEAKVFQAEFVLGIQVNTNTSIESSWLAQPCIEHPLMPCTLSLEIMGLVGHQVLVGASSIGNP
ncbi:ty3-gypsy retrotransposon protein, partial [Tanacetum coccineum]